jgi:CubicO group peptidase (beta-lactamase class C family)
MLFMSQEERRIAFRHVDELYPTREIEAAGSPFPLADQPQDFSTLSYEVEGESFPLSHFLTMSYSKGLIVVREGKVLLEHYGDGHDRNTRWVSFSVAKSVTSMLIGAAIRDGYIESVDEPVANYLPRFRGTPYEESTIRNVLQMSSGVTWNEDYADPGSDVSRAGGLNGIDLVRYLSRLPRGAEPGELFNYNTGETNLVGEILRAAIGNNASTYLSHKIWGPFGMESNASWLLGSEAGGETGGCCINATLRDYARIGIFALRGGVLPDGTRVLPDHWMADSIAPSAGFEGYGYLWWPRGDGSYSARGIFGQQITVVPDAELVIALHGNAPAAVGTTYHDHMEAAVAALIEELSASG